MSTTRSHMATLGLGAFWVLLGTIVALILWGLLTIDGVLARAGNELRETTTDLTAARVQYLADHLPGRAGAPTTVQAAAAEAMRSVRRPPEFLAIIGPGVDTVFVPARWQIPATGEGVTARWIWLATRDSMRLLASGIPTTERPRTALWVVGLLGTLLLGIGVARERYQSLEVAARSADVERLSVEALRANAMKSEFLANVSHELRTPLTAIVGFVEMLRDGVYGDLAPRQIGPVDRIAASATHLRHLVDQILDIARIAAGRLEVTREMISLRPYVLNIASELESLFNERSLRLSISVPTTLPRVRTDPTHLRHILVNLLGNAAKYTPAGTVSVRAKLLRGANAPMRRTPDDPTLSVHAPARDAPWIALQVADTGVGVPERDRERIFDEFEQVNPGPRTDSVERGTGLGLAISRRLARSLGGDITVESEVGKGSTFTMWIPVDASDLAASAAKPNTESGGTPAPVRTS